MPFLPRVSVPNSYLFGGLAEFAADFRLRLLLAQNALVFGQHGRRCVGLIPVLRKTDQKEEEEGRKEGRKEGRNEGRSGEASRGVRKKKHRKNVEPNRNPITESCVLLIDACRQRACAFNVLLVEHISLNQVGQTQKKEE